MEDADSAARQPRRLSAADFDAVRPLLRIREPSVIAARRVLVDGASMREVAAEQKWASANNVLRVVNVVWEAAARLREAQSSALRSTVIPPGWEQVTLVAPRALIERFQAELAEHMAQASHGTPPKRSRATRKASS